MRVLGRALAGVLALTTLTAANADQPGPKTKPAGRAPGTPQVTGSGSGSPTVPADRSGEWHQNPRSSGQWEERWARSHRAPNQFYGFWGPPEAWSVPYSAWGSLYFPYRRYGDWGALWYPYDEWRGPHGGWGNP
jgi:hypothetical protein